MRGSKGSDSPSALALNPRNAELSAARRTELLAQFNDLHEDDQADLLELAETWAFRATAANNPDSAQARDLFRRMYAAAGWEER